MYSYQLVTYHILQHCLKIKTRNIGIWLKSFLIDSIFFVEEFKVRFPKAWIPSVIKKIPTPSRQKGLIQRLCNI